MQHTLDDSEDRQNRFLNPNPADLGGQRAASQPPRSSEQSFLSSPTIPSSFGSTWSNPRLLNPPARGNPQPIPVRSSSFSANQQSSFSSAMRERSFSSTFEDDESEVSDTYDDRYIPHSLNRGRTYAPDLSRSRSQSLATGRPIPQSSSAYLGGSAMASWNDSFLNNGSSRYGEIKPPTSRYGSLGAMGRSPTTATAHSSSSPGYTHDISNMSPFVRDVGQILLDDGSAFRELWAGVNPPRDENGGGGSGTTSRRHSVSVVQPRRGGTVVGFNAPGQETPTQHEEQQPKFTQPSFGSRGGLMLSDEDLAGDLNLLSLNHYPRQEPIHFGGSPSDSGLDGSPHNPAPTTTTEYTARFTPGRGIHYLPSNGNEHHHQQQHHPQQHHTPVSPTSRQFYPRRTSDAAPPSLTELGKGLPLSAVPSSMPLFIVEFKAGRTDLFYLTDLSLDIRVGDLVIVEADRGKDLGKVVNDSITLAEVEAWQRERGAAAASADLNEPTSPGGAQGGGGGGSKKEISPKMIYGKAQPQDAQLLVSKMQDEMKALQLCQNKVRAKKLPMEVVDAEYQWDRRKLTFYFVAEKRIDFRELVRELFRLYKTRIWMASLQGAPGSGGGYEH